MKKWSLALLAPVVFWATAASAAVTTYTNEADWMSAAGIFITEPFSGVLLPSTGVSTSTGSIQSDHWHDRVTRSGGESTSFFYQFGPLLGAGGTWGTAPAFEGQALGITINLTGGGTEYVDQIGPIAGFFGWISDSPFDSFTIQAGNHEGVAETFDLDDLRMSLNTTRPEPDPTPTPEPATLALVATALASTPFVRRRFGSRS